MKQPHHMTDIDDVSPTELREILSLSRAVRDAGRAPSLEGRSLGLLFEKPSTRTRVSFEAGMTQLGGHAIFLSPDDLQLGRGEPIADTARALSGYLDVIAARMTDHDGFLELANHSSVPVINALTDRAHPCQTLADLLTIEDHFGSLEGCKVAWVGDGNNVAQSFVIGAAMAGIEVSVATPPAYGIDAEVIERAHAYGSTPSITDDPIQAVEDADFIYTDVWMSMGDGEQRESKLPAFDGFQVNDSLLSHAPGHVSVMHCLPAVRGEEISSEVLDGEASLVWKQAENRMYAQQGLLTYLLNGTKDVSVGVDQSYQDSLQSIECTGRGPMGSS